MLPTTKNWKQVKTQLRLPWGHIFLVLSILSVLIYLFSGDQSQTKKFYDEIEPMELGKENAFVHSAYYFPSSKSLGPNAVAIVATMNKNAVTDINEYRMKIVGTNSTKRFVTEAKLSTEQDPDESCEYTTVLIQTNSLDSMSKLEIETRDGLITLPISEPIKVSPKPVVFCIAPLFAAEQWQSFLAQLHVSKKFGAHLHVYMMTMVEYYYQMVRELGQLGIITTQPWVSVKFSQVGQPFVEPNRNSELRNPAAAYTDCLLQYKEAAQFIGFLEMEDLLFPLNSQTYYEEFEREFEGSFEISALYYQVVEHNSMKYASVEQQSVSALLSYSKAGTALKRGRSVVRPERYNSTWTHYSTQADKQPIYLTEQQEEPHYLKRKSVSTNAFLRFKNLEYTTDPVNTTVIPAHLLSSDQQLLSEEQLKEIDQEIEETLSLPTLQEYIKKLPTEDFYTPKLEQCLANQPAGKGRCVNTKSCKLPNSDKFPCRHSDGLYHSGRVMKPYTFHFITEYYFTRNLGCYE